MAKILIIGCGDIGYRVGLALQAQGEQVIGVRRYPQHQDQPFPMIAADITIPASLVSLPVDLDAVLIIVSPDARQPETYRLLFDSGVANLLEYFAKVGCKAPCLLVSSTSVYAQNNGEWVDETSPTTPDNACSQWLVAAEQRIWQAGVQHCVVRFSGIYGPGRDFLRRKLASGAAIQISPPVYTNRIHRDDCVAVLLFLLNKKLQGEPLANCYLASDDDPASQWDVMSWLAEQFGYPQPASNTEPDGMQNKRCNNARLKALGYQFIYPSFREGYVGCL